MTPLPWQFVRERVARLFAGLWDAQGGAALVEFAISLPLLTTLGMYGTELAYTAMVNQQISDIAISLGDNASRLGQTDNSAITPTVSKAELDSIMVGALKQGKAIELEQRGRIILSSLEYDAGEEKQFIHWQSCVGNLNKVSDYGDDGENNGLNDKEITGLGNGTQTITAPEGSAVMFVEVFYEYQGVFGTLFIDGLTMKREAAFIIRDDRNLAGGVSGLNGASLCPSPAT